MRGFAGIMQRLDRNRFEPVGLVHQEILPFCRKTVHSDDVSWIAYSKRIDQAYQEIRNSECDVIMHWHAGTDITNYFLPFLPLAPVQCIGFGNHGTTGIQNIDHFVSSKLFERGPDAEDDYSESLAQFDGLTTWQRRPHLKGKASRSEFGLPKDTLYFCPQRLQKFHPDFDPILRSILEKDPNGRIVTLNGKRPHAAKLLWNRWERTLGPHLRDRIIVVPFQKHAAYERLLSVCDVVLDSPCYSASLTGFDAFAFGIPLVTLPGDLMVQRYAKGLYDLMGLEEMITINVHDYISTAVRLGRDRAYRRSTSEKILDRSGVLYENDRVVEEYEQFFMSTVGCKDTSHEERESATEQEISAY